MITLECHGHITLDRALAQLAAVKGEPLADVIRQNARLIAVNLALQTQPFGNGKNARAQGEFAAGNDIGKVYMTPQAVFRQLQLSSGEGNRTGRQLARSFYASVMRGDNAKAQEILRASGISGAHLPVEKFDDGAFHQRRRNSRGRIGGEHPSQVVSDPQNLLKYQRKIVRNVGMAKAGWAQAASGLGGTRGIPQFVTRHKKKVLGSVTDNTRDEDAPHVVMHNTVPWIKQVLTERQELEALRMQREKMVKHINRVLREEARKARLNLT